MTPEDDNLQRLITLMAETVSISETLAYFYEHIPEGSNLHTHPRKNLKYHLIVHIFNVHLTRISVDTRKHVKMTTWPF
jgi:hypothetical protein